MGKYAIATTHQAFTAMAALTPSVDTLPFTSRPRFACMCRGDPRRLAIHCTETLSTPLASCGYTHIIAVHLPGDGERCSICRWCVTVCSCIVCRHF